jgi:outer membrane protein, multidrug efflux system
VKRVALVMAAAALSACMHAPPKAAAAPLPARAPLDALKPGAIAGTWPEERWWKHYGDPTLDTLIDQALQTAPSLNVARARFQAARASVREIGANVGARVDLQASIERQRLSDNGLFPPEFLGFSWYNQADLGLQASYTFDWWGRQRAAIESAIDQARAREADGAAARLTLASSIADAYFGWQVDQARLALARERAADAEKNQAIAAARVRAEIDPPDVQHAAEGAAATAREQVAGLEGSARLRVVALAALAGRAPEELPPLVARDLPEVSAQLPADVGIDLMARRPDIAASRWRVESAVKGIESVRAEFYPDISLKALVGVQSIKLGKLLRASSGVPAVTAAVHLPLFDAGRLRARYGSSQSQLQSAVADYDEAVTNAAREVATQAALLTQLERQRRERAAAVVSSQGAVHSATLRVAAGVTDLRPQLDANQLQLTQRDAALQLQAAALSADIALRRALGGGFDSRVQAGESAAVPPITNLKSTP